MIRVVALTLTALVAQRMQLVLEVICNAASDKEAAYEGVEALANDLRANVDKWFAAKEQEAAEGTEPCSICGGPLGDKDGNNAQPVNDGRCCAKCNATVVIPARMAGLGMSQ